MQIGLAAQSVLLDQAAGGKSVESKGRSQRMGFRLRDQVRETPASGRDGLEATGAPRAVQKETLHGCTIDDG